MMNGAVDYAALYFVYKTPTQIIGAPTNKSIKRLKTELCASSSSVECALGGGHGYLGLILDDEEYATTSSVPFEAPHYPVPLVIPPGTSQVKALNRRKNIRNKSQQA